MLLDGENLLEPASTSTCCARASAWCSRSRRRSRCRSTTTSPSASGSTRSCRAPSIDDRVEEALRRAALWDEVKDKLNASGLGLSGGQQQRLCIARTVAVKPEVHAARRAVLGARSDLDRQDRGADRRAASRTTRIVIVTHNMQQAARVSRLHRLHVSRRADRVRRDREDLHHPRRQAHRRTTSPAGSAERARRRNRDMASDHILKRFDQELERLNATINEMGGLTESQFAKALTRGARARHAGRRGGDRRRRQGRRARCGGAGADGQAAGAAPADGQRPAHGAVARSRSPRRSSASATTPRTSPSAASC